MHVDQYAPALHWFDRGICHCTIGMLLQWSKAIHLKATKGRQGRINKASIMAEVIWHLAARKGVLCHPLPPTWTARQNAMLHLVARVTCLPIPRAVLLREPPAGLNQV